jgi:hypothetical protein
LSRQKIQQIEESLTDSFIKEMKVNPHRSLEQAFEDALEDPLEIDTWIEDEDVAALDLELEDELARDLGSDHSFDEWL